jgi:hypothetical protein
MAPTFLAYSFSTFFTGFLPVFSPLFRALARMRPRFRFRFLLLHVLGIRHAFADACNTTCRDNAQAV